MFSVYKSFLKNFIINSYKLYQILIITSNIFYKKRKGLIKVYYGGARSGNIGGPLVKVDRLKDYFPESYNFNILYTLSNANYLNKFSIKILKKKKIPIILNQNGVFYPSWFPNKWEFKNKQMAEIYHKADYVFWQSEFCKRSAEYFLGIRNYPGEVLYNSVDTKNKFYPKKNTNRSFTFLMTGKFTEIVLYRIKNSIEGFIKAREMGSDFKLIIAGWYEKSIILYINNMINKFNLQESLKLIGPYRQSEACKIYQLADVYLTTKYLDPCPNAVIEAMACGLPIIYSNSGGIPELVGDKCGIGLDVPFDWEKIYIPEPMAIAKAMQKIYFLSEKMGLESRKRALDRFDINIWVNRHKEVFQNLLNY
tara:strand:+ start:1258 stop:2352 length:1095 start_codon:yes stop_codon:yes gene_type:complete